MQIQLRRNPFSNGTIASPKCLLTSDSIPRPPLLPLPHLRMQTHPPHSKPVPPPPCPHSAAPAAAPVTLAAGATAGGSAQKKKKKVVEHFGTSCDTTCACADLPSLLPLVLHDMHLSGGISNPSHVTCGPIIQRPGNCHHPFNTSNSLSCQSIVVIVESKAAAVALLPLALQISHFINSLSSLIMVKSFHLSYGGLYLTTTSVPTPSDLARVETFMHTLVPEGSSVQCEVLSLHSFCKLIGVLFLCGGKPINPKDASLILSSSVYKESICLATSLRIVCDSRWAKKVIFTVWAITDRADYVRGVAVVCVKTPWIAVGT